MILSTREIWNRTDRAWNEEFFWFFGNSDFFFIISPVAAVPRRRSLSRHSAS